MADDARTAEQPAASAPARPSGSPAVTMVTPPEGGSTDLAAFRQLLRQLSWD